MDRRPAWRHDQEKKFTALPINYNKSYNVAPLLSTNCMPYQQDLTLFSR